MNILKNIVRTESALLYRNKFMMVPLIINVLFWGYLIISYEIQSVRIQERAAVFYSGFIWILLFNLLFIGLFAVYMTSKDRESEFESLVMTYQVKNAEWVTGKWLVTQLYGLCITLVTLLAQFGWFASGKMGFGDIVKNLFYLFVQMEGALFITVSIGFLCGILMKNMFAYILMTAILVLTLILPVNYTDAGSAQWFDNPGLHLLTPLDLMYVGSPHEGIWGIERVFGSSLVHQSAVYLFGFVVLLVALLLFHSKRRIQKEKKLVPILIVVLIIPTLLLSGIRYTQYNEAFEKYKVTGQQYVQKYEGSEKVEDFYKQLWLSSYYDDSLEHKKYDISMESINLAVQLQSDNQLDVTSKLMIKHNGDKPVKEVYLTLYHGLTLTECASKSEITCMRDKDLVTVHFEDMIEPGEEIDLSLNYKGNILQYRDEGNVEHSFIKMNRVYLPKEAGWYPLIGDRQLIIAWEDNQYYAQFTQRNGKLVEDYPTNFMVEILNEAGEIPLALTIPETAAGMYEGISQYGLSLVGGNVKETKVGEVRVVGHPEVLKSVKEKVEHYQKGWDFIEDWLGEPMTPSVIYILNSGYAYLTSNTPSREFQVWDTEKLTHADDAEAFAYDLWSSFAGDYSFESISTDEQSYLSEQAYGYLREATIWVILNQFYEVVSFKDWYIDRRFHGPDESEDKLLNLLNRYAEKGNGEFEAVVKYLLIYFDQLEDKNEFDIEKALQLYERDSSL